MSELASQLVGILGGGKVEADPKEISHYLSGQISSSKLVLVFPESTEEVQEIVLLGGKEKIPIYGQLIK